MTRFLPALLLAAAVLSLSQGAAAADGSMRIFSQNSRILFQGDSITDGGRGQGPNVDPNHTFGGGYAYIIAARNGAKYYQRNLFFMNRGIGGQALSDLVARWQADTLDLKPDVVSILVGINDTDDVIHQNPQRHMTLDQWRDAYDKLLADTVAALPGVKLVLGEPYVMPATGGRFAGSFEQAKADVVARQKIVIGLGKKFHAAVVDYQAVFDEAARRAPVAYWVWDGIHPTYSGHELMADAWERAVRAYWP